MIKTSLFIVRDLWQQKELGIYNQKFSAQVPAQGVVMIKISKRKR